MKVHVLAFASVAEALGGDRHTLELADGARLSTLRRRLEERAPALAGRDELAWAVDGELVRDDPRLADGVEVAILPPVSGGSSAADDPASAWVDPPIRAALVDGPIDVDAARQAVSGAGFGAVLLFLGTVRDRTLRDGPDAPIVDKLTYDAYRSMAQSRLETIVAELESGDEIDGEATLRVAIVHRLGEVPVGEASVVIATASPHREAAYAASRVALERLKREVPIWKQEHRADGGATWREEEPLAPSEPAPSEPAPSEPVPSEPIRPLP